MEGLDEEMVAANHGAAIWLIKGYEPGQYAEGAFATVANGALPYPASSQMGLMQSAIANNISAFMNDEKDAATTLADIEADYVVSAKEAGLLN